VPVAKTTTRFFLLFQTVVFVNPAVLECGLQLQAQVLHLRPGPEGMCWSSLAKMEMSECLCVNV
jgi:hypothetical protein